MNFKAISKIRHVLSSLFNTTIADQKGGRFGSWTPITTLLCFIRALLVVHGYTILPPFPSRISRRTASGLFVPPYRVSKAGFGSEPTFYFPPEYGWLIPLSPHILHAADIVCLWIRYFMLFVLRAWSSCAAMIKPSVSFFNLPLFSHCHDVLSLTSSVFLKNWPWSGLSIYLCFLSSMIAPLSLPSSFSRRTFSRWKNLVYLPHDFF